MQNRRILWMVLFVFYGFCLKAQEYKSGVTKNYFIQNVWLTTSPGTAAVLTSVKVRDGIIEEIGPGIKPGFDYKIIKADSQYVYAGFIDAMSHTGIKKEEDKKETPKLPSRGLANYEQSGITPQNNALANIKPKDSSISDLRKSGFVLSHVFPRGRMIAGNSTLIALNDAEHEDKLVVKNNVAMQASFTPANGASPSTVIGVIARFKEFYQNTGLAIDNEARFAKQNLGHKKPEYVEEWQAMAPVYKKLMPLYFVTPKSKDVFRAVELQKGMGFQMVLADVQHLQPAIDKVKAGGYAVLLSPQLPEEQKEEKKEKGEKKEGQANADAGREEAGKANERTEEEKGLEKRKKEKLQEYLAQAALLEKNNISFAFSMANAKPADFLKSIRAMKKAGLSEKAALSALTTTPATMLQVAGQYGTLEKGKSASMVFFDKAVWDEKAIIKQVMVDGQMYVNEEKPKSEGKPGDGLKLEGEWSYTVDVQGQVETGRFKFVKEGKGYSGTSTSDANESTPMEDLIIDGNKVTFKLMINSGQPTPVTVELTFTNDSYTGNATIGEAGSFVVKGSKTNGPK
ncbi:MAG: amidohydrolase family protein [Saprospiraceae bacterium]|nr:amidohydrolase family protein [Saprospiraceae bacterium]MBK8848931.1 amidohydrolase family protein [Saprospiraceae bacterium]